MNDLICRKTMMRCNTPGTCSPHGGCRDDRDTALAAKDARIADLEGLLRYVRESAIYDNTVQAECIDDALSGNQSKPKGCTKLDCFPYCDCGGVDEPVPATPSEDGWEVPEVVGYQSTSSGLLYEEPRGLDAPDELMTVAQHSRIVAALESEINALRLQVKKNG